ncbi:MAG: hypothetical protein DRP87_03765 [Spirochaetes bacterium]|nr:MAG: hypothetical protein DRP87_03765 [Spirochaetota bacterium]
MKLPGLCTLTALFLFFTVFESFSQDYILPEEEAPEALFSTTIGSADVNLYILGSWNLSLAASLGIGYNTLDKTFYPKPFPGMDPGVIFKQIPDLTISLWLMDRYFFETTVIEDPGFNTFLLGYKGKKEEFLQSVLIGNRNIGMNPYSFLDLPEASENSLGASALFESEKTQHEILLRYDPTEKQEKIFIGENESIEERLNLGDYVTGRFFILPDENVENLTLYLEDGSGSLRGSDNRFYRRGTSSDAVLSESKGYVFLRKTYSGRILIYYEKNGYSVGHPSLGRGSLAGLNPSRDELDPYAEEEDFNWGVKDYLGIDMAERKVKVNGRDCLVLTEAGIFSPFELCNTYLLSEAIPKESWRVEVYLIKKGALFGEREKLSFATEEEENRIAVFVSSTSLRDPLTRYPFIKKYPLLYGPERTRISGYTDEMIVVQMLKPVDGYFLESDVIPGSVTVVRNGIEERNYRIDYDTGEIEFLTYIHPEDRIEIYYRTSSQSRRGGDFLMGIGNRISPVSGVDLEGGMGVRWNILGNTYSEKRGENPGSILTTAGIRYERDKLNLSMDGGISFSTPDTTGVFRIMGMEQAGMSIPISEDNIFPSSIPVEPINSFNLSRNNRGILYYKDFRTYNPFGVSALKPYTWEVPPSQVYPYKTGSKTGPYTASAVHEGIRGEVMVMDYYMNAEKKWVGAQIPLAKNQRPPDLSDYTSINFKWKMTEPESDVKVFFQLGAVGEDLDGDGVLDKEKSKSSTGFPFNDVSSGHVLLIGGGPQGTGNNRLDTEDFNNNGFLDAEKKELIIEKELTPVKTGWKTEQVFFTSEQRRKLTRASSLRIILINHTGDEVTGKVLVSDFTVAGSSFISEAQPSGNVTAREVSEEAGIAPPDTGSSLSDDFDEIQSVFHPEGEVQQVLEVSWDSIPVEGKWGIVSYTSPLPLDLYRKLNFYIRIPRLEGEASITLSMTGDDDLGLKVAFVPEKTEKWQKYSVDLEKAVLYLEGEEVAGSSVTLSSTGGTLARFSLELKGSPSGLLYMDELHLEEAKVRVSPAVSATVEYSIPGTMMWAGKVPAVKNLLLKERFSWVGEDFATGYGESLTQNMLISNTMFKADIFFLEAETQLGIIYRKPDLYLTGGHRLRLPAESFPVVLTDSYSQTESYRGRSFSRANSLFLSLSPLFSSRFEQETALFSSTLSQSWQIFLDSLWNAPLKLDFQGKIGKASAGFSIEEGFYFENWIKNYSLTIPWNGDASPERSGNSSASLNLFTQPLGFETRPALEYRSFGTTERLQVVDGSVPVKIPITLAAGTPASITITPGYMRSFSFTTTAERERDYFYDFGVVTSLILSQFYLFESAPLAELFSPGTLDDFAEGSEGLEEAEYKPALLLGFQRNPFSGLAGIFIPVEGNFELKRIIKRIESTLENRHLWEISIRNTAINLFGRMGVYPFFGFYDMEELTTVITLQMESYESIKPETTTFILQNFITLNKKGRHELTLDNRYSRVIEKGNSFSNDLKISFSWRKPLKPSVKMPLPDFIPLSRKEDIENKTYFLHTEGLELLLESSESNSKGVGIGVVIKHETGLHIPEIGFLKGSISLGIDRRLEELLLFGIRGGIEAQLSF